MVAAMGAAVGFAQDPDADRLAIVDESGRYIGEELTLALAALRRFSQTQGPVVLNLSTSSVTEVLARRAGCPVLRTPVGEINVVEAMLANNAILGGEGNGGVIDPRVGFVRDSFVGMAVVLDLLASDDRPLSAWVDSLPRLTMVKDQYPLGSSVPTAEVLSALWDRIARAMSGRPRGPAGRTTPRLGRPLGACPLEQYRADCPRDRRGVGWDTGAKAGGRGGRMGAGLPRPRAMSASPWPTFEQPPSAAFVDVDGTLLAETTTFLFARILYRKGLIRRSFLLRALYHGLQHKLGRLDYGRLIAYGLANISRIPVVELERIAYENFVEHVKPRLYEGVVEHFNALRRRGTPIVLVSSSPGLVIEPLSIYLGCSATLTTPVVIERNRLIGIGPGPLAMAKASSTGPNGGPENMG